jgi:hypothetical protein
MTKILTNWTEQNALDYGKRSFVTDHNLHEDGAYSDESLANLLDRYPREQLGIFTMGQDPENWMTFVPGEAGDMSGADIVEATKKGRIWLNLRRANHVCSEYDDLCKRMFEELGQHLNHSMFKQDVGILISSPKAQVFYHLDVPLVMLWHLRGVKRLWCYPPTSKFIRDRRLESIVLSEVEEELEYDPAFDEEAMIFDLQPGQVASWPQFGPHRIENHDMLNVSLSVEYMSVEALVQANMVYANGVLRRKFGADPVRGADSAAKVWAKAIAARGFKAFGSRAAYTKVRPPHFMVDLNEKDCVRFYDMNSLAA